MGFPSPADDYKESPLRLDVNALMWYFATLFDRVLMWMVYLESVALVVEASQGRSSSPGTPLQ